MTGATHLSGSSARWSRCWVGLRQRPQHVRVRFMASASRPNDGHEWPSASPTPYDILNCQKGGTFSKAYYFELVKRYHPDLMPKTSTEAIEPWHQLSEAVRKERLQMVYLAKEILSSPEKKRLYDSMGVGWIHPAKPKVYGGAEGYGTGGRYDSSWCATWEDWETFRAQRDGTYKKPELLMEHWKFTSIAVVFSCIGGLLAFGIAQNEAKKRANFYDKVSAELEDVMIAIKSNPVRIGSVHGRAQAIERLRGGSSSDK